MTPLATALSYLDRFGWWLLPCQWAGPRRKQPLVKHGFHDASNDPAQIGAWWTNWPAALIGVATGASGLACLDVDVKDPKKFGPDSLDDLGRSILDVTWIAHSASGGWHVYYAAGGLDIPSSTHTLGPGLDVRACGGYIIAPSPDSGYAWDPHCNPDTVPLASAPEWLIPPPSKFVTPAKPVKPAAGLSPYADAAIEMACRAIRGAGDGLQRTTLLKEAFTIGTLTGAGGIPENFARAALIDAGSGMPSYDPHYPWTPKEIARVVNHAFEAGLAHPRPVDTGRRVRR